MKFISLFIIKNMDIIIIKLLFFIIIFYPNQKYNILQISINISEIIILHLTYILSFRINSKLFALK